LNHRDQPRLAHSTPGEAVCGNYLLRYPSLVLFMEILATAVY